MRCEKAGYLPRVSVAKAEMPTILRFVRRVLSTVLLGAIPSLNISQVLSSSGVTETNLGVLKPGTIQGLCSMGLIHLKSRLNRLIRLEGSRFDSAGLRYLTF